MWMRVALDRNSLVFENSQFAHVDGPHMEEYYFDENVAMILENDGFLLEMWKKLDAMFDWYDCDFFNYEKCIKFRNWLEERLRKEVDKNIKPVYVTMLDYAKKAINANTGIYFDF